MGKCNCRQGVRVIDAGETCAGTTVSCARLEFENAAKDEESELSDGSTTEDEREDSQLSGGERDGGGI